MAAGFRDAVGGFKNFKQCAHDACRCLWLQPFTGVDDDHRRERQRKIVSGTMYPGPS